MTRVALAWLVAAGCWRDPPPASPDQVAPAPETATMRPLRSTPTACELSVDHALALVEQLPEVEPGFAAQEAQLRPLLVEHCDHMQWSDDALQCVRTAQTPDELYAHCRDRFSQDQLNDVVRVMQQLPP